MRYRCISVRSDDMNISISAFSSSSNSYSASMACMISDLYAGNESHASMRAICLSPDLILCATCSIDRHLSSRLSRSISPSIDSVGLTHFLMFSRYHSSCGRWKNSYRISILFRLYLQCFPFIIFEKNASLNPVQWHKWSIPFRLICSTILARNTSIY